MPNHELGSSTEKFHVPACRDELDIRTREIVLAAAALLSRLWWIISKKCSGEPPKPSTTTNKLLAPPLAVMLVDSERKEGAGDKKSVAGLTRLRSGSCADSVLPVESE